MQILVVYQLMDSNSNLTMDTVLTETCHTNRGNKLNVSCIVNKGAELLNINENDLNSDSE
jgi:hypothetical protein